MITGFSNNWLTLSAAMHTVIYYSQRQTLVCRNYGSPLWLKVALLVKYCTQKGTTK
jgi:hypothetical protein